MSGNPNEEKRSHMQFYFIRHGQSQNNWLYSSTGSWEGRTEDPDLTPLGRHQAEKLGQFLRQPGLANLADPYDSQNIGGFGITHLYCSLMVRAVATGAAVARALDLPLVAWEEAHEVGGIHHKDPETREPTGLPGRNRAYFEAHYPELILPDSLGDEGWWNRPYEEREQRPARARRFLNELLERHGDSEDRVAVISHGGFHNHLMRAVLNIPPELECWITMNNTAISRVDFGEGYIALQYLNRLDFLPREMVT
jgi:2,3-bisphosphoglycerate-dependent phosphoglycerate mutase